MRNSGECGCVCVKERERVRVCKRERVCGWVQQCVDKLEFEVLAFDLKQRLPFRLKAPRVEKAMARGIVFEISYGDLLNSGWRPHHESRRGGTSPLTAGRGCWRRRRHTTHCPQQRAGDCAHDQRAADSSHLQCTVAIPGMDRMPESPHGGCRSA